MLDNVLRIIEALAESFPLLWQHECVRNEVEVLFAEATLHVFDVNGQTVLPG